VSRCYQINIKTIQGATFATLKLCNFVGLNL
jgi:hypothetical protein